MSDGLISLIASLIRILSTTYGQTLNFQMLNQKNDELIRSVPKNSLEHQLYR